MMRRMDPLKDIGDLPEAQQKALFTILRLGKPAFRTSEVGKKMPGALSGRSVGAVMNALQRNGYLEKVQGGRDKMWRLSANADANRDEMSKRISGIKAYWS